MVPDRRLANGADGSAALEAELTSSLENFRAELETFSQDVLNEHRYREAIGCLRKAAVQIEGALCRGTGSMPDAQLSGAEQRYKQAVIQSSEDLLTQSRRILRQMRELAAAPCR